MLDFQTHFRTVLPRPHKGADDQGDPVMATQTISMWRTQRFVGMPVCGLALASQPGYVVIDGAAVRGAEGFQPSSLRRLGAEHTPARGMVSS